MNKLKSYKIFEALQLKITDYSITALYYDRENLPDNYEEIFNIIGLKIPKPKTTFSQYKKELNNLLIGKWIFAKVYHNKKYLGVKIRVRRVSTDQNGYLQSFVDWGYEKFITVYNPKCIDFIAYVNLLRNLEGQEIRFSYINKYKVIPIENFQLKKVSCDVIKGEIYFIDEQNNKYIVDSRESITKSRIITQEDPYGEEIWESASSNDKILLHYLKPTKQIIKGSEILQLIKKDDLTNFKNDFKGWLKISPRYKSYLFNVVDLKLTKDHSKDVLFASFDRYFDEHGAYKNRDSTITITINESVDIQKYIIVEPINNLKSDIDPFDEEDWDWDLF